ncbi:dephospho-CoA kinase [Alloalcanivorax mobilis]|uniref:dephospho-CoA kinase n=1 Tax=Alloalcanivorax mobilis TaxID=2019569 RepID=UPI000C7656BA|nr:dephospho-CoA kinase [Alloalcanivorax mobilis]|tara:strand:+ start:191 stop:790 length:600 start_codon:yes stop_codon:yes gene_type:complete
MFVVGLTGGIGSGKSAATDYLGRLGITIVDADLASRVVVAPGSPALAAIADRFGDVLQSDGSLNRRALRDIVFADEQARRDLEAITHPAIGLELRRQIKASASPYTILVSPLLLEGSQKEMVQRVMVVDVAPELQMARTVVRDEVPESQVEAIMRAQMDRETRLRLADDVVENHGPLEDLHQRLNALHQHYLQLADRYA